MKINIRFFIHHLKLDQSSTSRLLTGKTTASRKRLIDLVVLNYNTWRD